MNDLLRFISMADPNVRYVVLGTLLVGISSSVIGNFAYLRKRALLGDAIAHAVLPGICLAYMLQGTRSLWVLLPGAFISGWLALQTIDWIDRKSRIKPDAAIGLVLSVFFGAGVMLLTRIQQTGTGTQSGLKNFLFGQAAAIQPGDLVVFAITGIVLCGGVALFFKEFTLLSFDPEFSRASGLPVRWLELLLSTPHGAGRGDGHSNGWCGADGSPADHARSGCTFLDQQAWPDDCYRGVVCRCRKCAWVIRFLPAQQYAHRTLDHRGAQRHRFFFDAFCTGPRRACPAGRIVGTPPQNVGGKRAENFLPRR